MSYRNNTIAPTDKNLANTTEELAIEHTPIQVGKKTVEMPCWFLLLLSDAFIILLIVTFCIVFAFKQATVGFRKSFLTNSD